MCNIQDYVTFLLLSILGPYEDFNINFNNPNLTHHTVCQDIPQASRWTERRTDSQSVQTEI